MTEEVGKLNQEKQVVESQISVLFAFYMKQKPAPPVSSYKVSLSPYLKVLEMNIAFGNELRPWTCSSQQTLPRTPRKRVRANTGTTPHIIIPCLTIAVKSVDDIPSMDFF